MTARKFETFLRILDETQLEQWVRAYINVTFQTDRQAQRIGRKGQLQKGVDIHATVRGVGEVGYQAKAYVNSTLTIADFDKELAAAETFKPPLASYTIVTLNPRDARLQEHVREATLHGERSVQILALEDLADICEENAQLRKLLLQMSFSADDVENLLSAYVVDATSLPIKVLPIESDERLPAELRAADDWINAGMPVRALTSLQSFHGVASQSAKCRIECRAYFALEDFARIVEKVEEEQARPDCDASVLALGAQAANELDDHKLCDDWLALALTRATSSNRKDAVAGYIRVHSARKDATLVELEEFATSALGDPLLVAVALADASAKLGDRPRALHWYAAARQQRATRPLGVEINEICSSLVLALNRLAAGAASQDALLEPTRQLEGLLPTVRACEASGYAFVVLNALGFAYEASRRSVDAARAWDEALEANDDNLGLWVRRCALSAQERLPLPDQVLIDKYAVENVAKCALAMGLTLNGQFTEAGEYITKVLEDDAASEDERVFAHVERLRLQKATGELDNHELVAHTLALLTKHPESMELLSWAALHYDGASPEQKSDIQHRVSEFPIERFDGDAVLSLSSLLESKGLGALASRWLARLEVIAFDALGDIHNIEAADLVANIYLSLLRFDDAVRVRQQIALSQPLDSGVVQQLSRAYFESGQREEAYRTLDRAVRAGVTSSRLILNWALLASTLGHRREAARALRLIQIPASASPEDYTRLLHARILLGLRGTHDDVLAGLRRNLVTPDNAARVFGLGLHLRPSRNPSVSYGTVVQVQIADVFENTICIVETPSPPLPGIQTLDAENHPWVRDLLGAEAGDLVDISCGAFEGRQAAVRRVFDATDWVVHQARELITISAPERTGVESISGDTETQIAITKDRLQRRSAAVSDTMSRAAMGRVPITLLAERYQTSPREFLRAHSGWIPASYGGTTEEVARDDAALQSDAPLLFDAVSILLLIEIGAEPLLSSLPGRPLLTRQSAWQLFDWYMVEREGRQAAAHLSLSADGRLVITHYGAAHRTAMLRYWRNLKTIVQQHFEIVDSAPLRDGASTGQLRDILGMPALGNLSLAQRDDLVLVSEEQIVRGVAHHLFQAKSASLHRLIAGASERGWISRTRATLWLARLITLGWTWVSFPTWMVDQSLRLNDSNRWPVAEAFFGRMRTADAQLSIQTLLRVLHTADNNGYRQLDLPRLRQMILRALPRVDPKQRAAIAGRYAQNGSGRKYRATLKMLRRWAEL